MELLTRRWTKLTIFGQAVELEEMSGADYARLCERLRRMDTAEDVDAILSYILRHSPPGQVDLDGEDVRAVLEAQIELQADAACPDGDLDGQELASWTDIACCLAAHWACLPTQIWRELSPRQIRGLYRRLYPAQGHLVAGAIDARNCNWDELREGVSFPQCKPA